MNMIFERKLAIPQEVKKMFPLDNELHSLVQKRDNEIKKILSGEDDRLLLIIGPCSADNEDSVIDYISRLRRLQDKVIDRIYIIPRIYTNKPRTTGDGYKGVLHQPDPRPAFPARMRCSIPRHISTSTICSHTSLSARVR